ncbi:MAG: hypothetical protein ACLVHE_08550, partial [Dialister invisus]
SYVFSAKANPSALAIGTARELRDQAILKKMHKKFTKVRRFTFRRKRYRRDYGIPYDRRELACLLTLTCS